MTNVSATVESKACPFCGSTEIIRLRSMDDYNSWVGGTLIQNAMPYLTPSQRERLMTGICDPCWHETFKVSEEYDD